MKLCIVTQNVVRGNGQGRVNYEIVQEALRQRHHVTLLASRIAPELAQHQQVDWVKLSVQAALPELAKERIFASQAEAWLQQHRAEFDIVNVNGASSAVPSHVNAVHFVHSTWLRSPYHIIRQRHDGYGVYQWLYTALNSHWEKQAFHKAKRVVAVSGKIKQELLDIGLLPDRVQVILNGVDVEEFRPGCADRPTLHLPETVPIALFVGDMHTNRKNLETVLQAMVQVPALHLAVVGTIERTPYPAMAEALQLSDRVHFLGFRRDVAKIMQAVDLFVFPSRYEACTLVLLEAMASGLPVVTAATTGGAEMVTPESGVVLSDSEDVSALAAVLSEWVAQPEQRRQMGKAGRSIAEQQSWKQMAQAYLSLFQELHSPCSAKL